MGAMRWSWIFDRDLQRDFIGGVGYRNTPVPSVDALNRFLKDGLTEESGV